MRMGMTGSGGMISFGAREDVVPSVLVILSIVLLAGTLAYMLLVPKPSAARSARAWTSSRRRMADDIANTRRQVHLAQAAIAPRLWRGDPEAITATILAQMTGLTGKHGLKLTAFRPERPQVFDGITEVRFDVQVAGPYAGVHALLDGLDGRGSKVVLRSIQIAPTAAAANTVTATLGLSAFVATDPDLLPPAVPLSVKGGAHG